MSLFEEFKPVSLKEWEAKITQDLKGKPYEDTLVFETDEGIKIQPVYNRESMQENRSSSFSFEAALEWKMNQVVELNGDYALANENAIQALKGGVNSLYFKGVIASEKDLATLLDGIMLDIIAVHFYHPKADNLKTWLESYCAKDALDINNLELYVYYDELGEALTNGQGNLKLDENELQNYHSIKGINYANAGASAAQELAFSLNQAAEYIHQKTEAGMTVDEAVNSLHFHLGIGTNFFMEIAKLRALRILWDLFTSAYEVEATVNIHAESSLFSLSAVDTHTNILRSTTAAMAAIIGGCNVLSVSPFDVKVTNQNAFSQRIARNIQIILKEEVYFGKVNEMAKGSYYIEQLTDELVEKALAEFKAIENQGGFQQSVLNNTIQLAVKEICNKKLNQYQSKKRTLLGVNKHSNPFEENELPNNDTAHTDTGDFKALQAVDLTARLLAEMNTNA